MKVFEDSYDPAQTKLKQRQKKIKTTKICINQGSSTTHGRISDSVCIYTPVTVKFSYANMKVYATGLAGLMRLVWKTW